MDGRGLVTAGLCSLLIAVGHVLAGGAVPDLALLVVLFPLLVGVVGVARGRSMLATLLTLAGGQLALHLLLALLHPHAAGPDTPTMVALHAGATVVVAVLLHHADGAVAAVGSALRRRLVLSQPGAPPADAPLPSLRVTTNGPPPRRHALATVPARRGPPVGC